MGYGRGGLNGPHITFNYVIKYDIIYDNCAVRDDGCGFDPGKRPGTGEGHFGIDGIKARLERIGGTLTIESSPGKGTKVAIQLKGLKVSDTRHRSLKSEVLSQP